MYCYYLRTTHCVLLSWRGFIGWYAKDVIPLTSSNDVIPWLRSYWYIPVSTGISELSLPLDSILDAAWRGVFFTAAVFSTAWLYDPSRRVDSYVFTLLGPNEHCRYLGIQIEQGDKTNSNWDRCFRALQNRLVLGPWEYSYRGAMRLFSKSYCYFQQQIRCETLLATAGNYSQAPRIYYGFCLG